MRRKPTCLGVTRRDFLRASLVGAGALMFPYVVTPRDLFALEAGQSIHPNVSPLRVVGLHDLQMTAEQSVRNTWADQERLVRAEVIHADMDRLACALAEEKNASAAWKKIFIKPPAKAWSDVVVAIKTNNISDQHTRSPVMAKLCHVLTDVLGVKAENVHIYDGVHGGDITRKSPFAGLPEGVRIENKWGGVNTPAPVSAPWKDGAGTSQCVGAIARGDVDILINVALCKGHGQNFGGFTMTMKNHFGTFDPQPGHRDGADYLLGINASPAVLGNMDKSGKVLFPRQQLCVIDALWASKGGPSGLPDAQPNRLFMGVFGPIVDYQVACQFRRDTMNWPVNANVLKRCLADFGFNEAMLPNGGAIIDAMGYA
jgi:hypothetical protein